MMEFMCTQYVVKQLRGRDEYFFLEERDSFYAILNMKIVPAGIRTTNPCGSNSLPLFDLLMIEHIYMMNAYQIPVSSLHINHSLTKVLFVTYLTKGGHYDPLEILL